MKRFEISTKQSTYEINADARIEGYDDLTFVRYNTPEKVNCDYSIVAQFRDWAYWKDLGEIVLSTKVKF